MARYELTGKERTVGSAVVAERKATGNREGKEIEFKYWGPKGPQDLASLLREGQGNDDEMFDGASLMACLDIGLDLRWRNKLFPSAAGALTGIVKAAGKDLDLIGMTYDGKAAKPAFIVGYINSALDKAELTGSPAPKAVSFAYGELVKAGKAREREGRLTAK